MTMENFLLTVSIHTFIVIRLYEIWPKNIIYNIFFKLILFIYNIKQPAIFQKNTIFSIQASRFFLKSIH